MAYNYSYSVTYHSHNIVYNTCNNKYIVLTGILGHSNLPAHMSITNAHTSRSSQTFLREI